MRIFILLLIFIPSISGECYITYGRVDKTATGRLVPVCEYNGLDILDGSSFRTASCMTCNCNGGALECCGFGVAGLVQTPPPGCQVIADGCSPVYVLQADQTLSCETGLPITTDTDLLLFNDLFSSVPGDTATNTSVAASNTSVPTTSTGLSDTIPIDLLQGMSTVPMLGGNNLPQTGNAPFNQDQYNTLGNMFLFDAYW